MSKEVKAKLCYFMKTEEEWDNITETSLKGELYIYDYGTDKQAKMKVGDGVNTVKDLPFIALSDNDELKPLELPKQLGTLKYNGDVQEPTWTSFNYNQLIISGTTSATDAGTYSAYFIPRKGYCWANTQTKESREVEWSIAPANTNISIDPASVELTLLNPTVNITVTSNIDISNIYIKNAGNTNLCTVSLKDNTLTILASNSYTSGETWITLASKDTLNYNTVETSIKVATKYPSHILEEASWEEISQVSKLGLGPLFWEIGDTKSIVLNGKVGEVEFNNKTVYTYIIGFDHNSEVEGKGISFGCFKEKLVDGTFVDVCLVDNIYSSKKSADNVFFIINDKLGTKNGWKACDMRYYVLGSTDKAPELTKMSILQLVTDRVGFDATETCATSPVENTLMSTLPYDLRSVLTVIIKKSSTYNGSELTLISSKDYMPLLSPLEITGENTVALYTTKDDGIQYSYYKTNSIIKYKHHSTYEKATWWLRSQCSSSTFDWCCVKSSTDNVYNTGDYNRSYGIAPIFKV